jgi:ubiquitin-protein ligase
MKAEAAHGVQLPRDESGNVVHFRQSGSFELCDNARLTRVAVWKRVAKEDADWKAAPHPNRGLWIREPRHMLGALLVTDPQSPYDGGLFYFEFKLPVDYPFKAPDVKLLTKIYHPAMSEAARGEDPGCLSIVREAWSPQLRIANVFDTYAKVLHFQTHFETYDDAIAEERLNHPAQFEAKARLWTQWFAHGPIPFGKWKRSNHAQFPAWMRRRVVIWLLVWTSKRHELCDMPRDVAMLICSFICTGDAYDAERDRVLGLASTAEAAQ